MSIITRPIAHLGSRTADTAVPFTRTGIKYDYALANVGLLSAAGSQVSYTRSTADFRKEQFDTSANPGEQTLTNWWLRSQSSFHSGAGINFMEPASDDEIMTSFNSSAGVDVWTPGQVTLLKATSRVLTGAGTSVVMGVTDSTGTDLLYQAETTLVYAYNPVTNAAPLVTHGGSGTVLSMTQDGTNYYVADSVGIWKGTLTGGAGSKVWNTGNANVVIGFPKQRLVAGIGASVYELVTGGPSLPTALYTHPNTSWKWTSITEGPTAIFMSGYAGNQSAIYKFTLSSGGAMPTLTSATVAATLPTGEVCYSVYAYLGAYIAIGTNKGVRIGVVDTNGDITYGPLVVRSTTPVYSLVGEEQYIYATCTTQIDGGSGLWRIDLGTQLEDGSFPYATDLQTHAAGTAVSITLVSGRLAIGCSGTGGLGGVWLESTSTLESTGYLRTGYVRFNTVEPKDFRYIRTKMTGVGSVTVETYDSTGASLQIASVLAESTGDYALQRADPEEFLAFRFTLVRATTTTGPTFTSYQVKALPAIVRSRVLQVPVLAFENMRDTKGAAVPPVDVDEFLADLEALENATSPVLFTRICRDGNLTDLVTIESVQFRSSSPPANCKGYGGVILLTLRTVQ